MQRRTFLSLVGLGGATFVISCGTDTGSADPDPPGGDEPTPDASPVTTDAPAADACIGPVVQLHDTYAQALYLDNSLGPLTGTIRVAQVIAGVVITLDFWHGHGGQLHRFTLEPPHFAALLRGERITVGTTMVDGHAHTLFIDPVDERYRVPGAPDIAVPLPCAG
jgi:hypothetical protein